MRTKLERQRDPNNLTYRMYRVRVIGDDNKTIHTGRFEHKTARDAWKEGRAWMLDNHPDKWKGITFRRVAE